MTHLGNQMTRQTLRSWDRLVWIGTVLVAGACSSGEAPTIEALPKEPGVVVLTPAQVSSAGVRVEPVYLTQVAETHKISATLASPDTATSSVGSVVEGRVATVLVLPGDQVREGQGLLEIHSHELTDALRNLRASEARLQYLEAAAGRSEALFSAGAVAREEVERRTAERSEARADVERASEWVEHLSPSPDGLVVVRAPRAGTVFTVSVVSGTAVLPGTKLVTLGRTDILWATGWVPERNGLYVQPGDAVMLTVPALGDATFSGHVVQVGAAVDSERRAVDVRVTLDSVPNGARPGLFATMTLPAGPSQPRAVLPAAAVQRMAAGDVVFVEVGAGRYRAVPVGSVAVAEDRVAVTGLTETQRVVIEGAYGLRSMMEVNASAGDDS